MSLKRGQLLSAHNLNSAFLSKTNVGAQTVVGPVVFLGDISIGTLQSGTVPWARLTNHPNITAGTGLDGGGSLSQTRTLSVKYGSTTGTAVEGNTSITINPLGNLSGGGSITLGSGGTLNLGISEDPSFDTIKINRNGYIEILGDNNMSTGQSIEMTRWHGEDSDHKLVVGYEHEGPYFIEANESKDIQIRTNSQDVIHISGQTGNVGIGRNSTSSKLSVQGDISVSGNVDGVKVSTLQTNFNNHASDTTVHISSTERSNWNAAHTHAGSAHAPADAPSGSVFTSHVSNDDIHVTASLQGNWNTAYQHSQSDHAPVDAPSNAEFTAHTENQTIHITTGERTNWNAAHTHISSDGTDHTFINQDVTTGASPQFSGLTINSGEMTIRSPQESGNMIFSMYGWLNTHKFSIGYHSPNGYFIETDHNSTRGDIEFRSVNQRNLVFMDHRGHVGISKKPSTAYKLDIGGSLNTTQIYIDGTRKDTVWDAKSDLQLGETDTTAYRGDRGKIAYDHSQSAHAPVDAPSRSEFEGHTEDGVVHITEQERTNWNAAKSHADSDHAPSDAPSGSDFTNHTSDTTIHITPTERSNWNAGHNHSQTPHAPSDAPSRSEFNQHTGDSNIHVTQDLQDDWNEAYQHSQEPHAPVNALPRDEFDDHVIDPIHITPTERDNWNQAYAHISDDGTSHTYIDQDVRTTASPIFKNLDIDNAGNISFKSGTFSGGWARNKIVFLDEDDTPYVNIGIRGSGSSFHYLYVGESHEESIVRFNKSKSTEFFGNISTTGAITASGKVTWNGGDSDKANAAYAHSLSDHLALGETSTTAYRGDRGKIAYDHSQAAHAPINAPSGEEFNSHIEDEDLHVTEESRQAWDSAVTHAGSAHAPVDAPSNQEFVGHTGNTSLHVSTSDRSKWNTAHSHSQSAHAPADAPSGSQFSEHVSDTNIHVTSALQSNWNEAYSHSQEDHAPSDAPSGDEFDEHVNDSAIHVSENDRNNWNEGYGHSQIPHAPSDAPSRGEFNDHINDTDIHLEEGEKDGLTSGNNTSLHIHDDRYLKLSGGTLAGPLTVTGGPGLTIKSGNSDHAYVALFARDETPNDRSGWIGYGSSGSRTLRINNQLNGDIRFTVPTGYEVRVGNDKIWHAGNVGQGSGLDADLLDGQHGSYYAVGEDLSNHIDDNDNPHSVTAEQVGAISQVAGLSNPGGNINITGTNNISVNASGSTVTISGTGVWPNASNAEKLDGVELESLLRSDENDTVNGVLTFSKPFITSKANNRTYYDVAALTSSSSSVTGVCKITLPHSWNNTMMRITIKGYNYSNRHGAWEVVIGGYNYSSGSGSWANRTATINGRAPFNSVRLAHDGDKCCILLGDVETSWNYPKIRVSEFSRLHGSSTGWESGWSIEIIDNEAGIDKIASTSISTYIDGNENFGIGTVTPSEKLDVSGNIRVSGNILMQSGRTVDGVDISSLKSSFDSHNHDERYYTQTQLSTSGQSSVHWNNIRSNTIPEASDQTKGVVQLGPRQSGQSTDHYDNREDFPGQGDLAARSDHFHAGLESVAGPGIIEGFEVVPLSTNQVEIMPGIAILADGARIKYPKATRQINPVSSKYVSWAVLYINPYIRRTSTGSFDESQIGLEVIQNPDAGSYNRLPVITHENAIPIAKIRLRPNSPISQSDIIPIRKYSQVRTEKNKDTNKEETNIYGEYIYDVNNEARTGERAPAITIGANGQDVLFHGKIATGARNQEDDFVDISARYKHWDKSVEMMHEHIYNEVLNRVSSTEYATSYTPLEDTKKDSNNEVINKAGRKISVFRNGQMQVPVMDYTISTNIVTFTKEIGEDEIITANYETIVG